MIAAVFGLVYAEANAAALPAPLMLTVRILGASMFVVVLIKLWLEGPDSTTTTHGRGAGFGGRYWLIVALEAAGIVAGSAVLRAVGLGSATVAWVSVVVGIHFVALAAAWRVRRVQNLGVAIAICGAVAIAAAATGAGNAWVAGIGAVLPGALLLWVATRQARTDDPGWLQARTSASSSASR